MVKTAELLELPAFINDRAVPENMTCVMDCLATVLAIPIADVYFILFTFMPEASCEDMSVDFFLWCQGN